ncbi:MAG: SDR family NAD(P)-dependent oxidoreductase [Solirubrobacterales bacterium]|nr:SDR family NAD(P)-dependent oxidoreductase [Solirubrobacterales bacterium]
MSYVALITGASSGIGEATARRLAREGDVRLVLVARREEKLRALAAELGGATVVAVDLTAAQAPAQVRETLEREHAGQLHLLVNNAGTAWRGRFEDVGWADLERHMRINFEAPARLTEALLPLLRATAAAVPAAAEKPHRRVAIVNVASTAARVSRPNSGAYSASKFALVGWSDALYAEQLGHGVHVGLVLPGFVRTEGFPAAELPARPQTRWLVSEPERVAEAILEAGPGGKAERYVPRWYWLAAALRLLAPALVRRATAGGALTTTTKASEASLAGD